MQKIQKLVFNFISWIGIILVFSTKIMADNGPETLKKADSLFQQKNYTEALSVYQNVFDMGISSPSMLLKMAFITEALHNHASALYYLNHYYLKTTDPSVLVKMEEIATEHSLEGYQSSDSDIALRYYYRYFDQLVMVVLAACFLFFLFILRNSLFKKKKIPYFVGIFTIFFAAALFYLVNFGLSYNKGIIVNPVTYIMNGPGAGSGVMEICGNGHRVNILGKEDVWLKILWKDKIGYIKDRHIRAIWDF